MHTQSSTWFIVDMVTHLTLRACEVNWIILKNYDLTTGPDLNNCRQEIELPPLLYTRTAFNDKPCNKSTTGNNSDT